MITRSAYDIINLKKNDEILMGVFWWVYYKCNLIGPLVPNIWKCLVCNQSNLILNHVLQRNVSLDMWSTFMIYDIVIVHFQSQLILLPVVSVKWLIIGSGNGFSRVNWTFKDKLQWNLNRDTNLFIHENTFEYVVCEMVVSLSRGVWVKVKPK